MALAWEVAKPLLPPVIVTALTSQPDVLNAVAAAMVGTQAFADKTKAIVAASMEERGDAPMQGGGGLLSAAAGLAKGAMGGAAGGANPLAGLGGLGGLGGLAGKLGGANPLAGLGGLAGKLGSLGGGKMGDLGAKALAAANAKVGADMRDNATKSFPGEVGSGIKKVTKLAFKLLPLLQTGMLKLYVLLVCLAVVGLILGVVALVVYMVFHVHPRTIKLNNSADFEGFMDGYFDDLLDTMCSTRANIDDVQTLLRCAGSDAGVGADVIDALGDVSAALDALAPRPMIREELERFFKYYHALQAPANFLNKYDLRNDPAMLNGGDLDADLHETFMTSVFEPAEQLRAALQTASEGFRLPDVNDALPRRAWYTPAACRLIGDLHMLHIMLNVYFVAKPDTNSDDIYFMYQTRKSGMPMALWTLYYWPYVRNIFVHRIPNTWKKFPVRITQYITSGLNTWATFGMELGLLPCKMAYQDPTERASRCKLRDGFQNGHGGSGGETIEAFSIFKALGSIVDFVKNLAAVGVALFNFMKKFPSDPFGSIIGIVMLIVGTIIGAMFMIWFILLTVLGIAFVVIFVIAFVLAFGWSLLSTIVKVLTAVLIAIPYLILWIADMMLGGVVMRLMRCENLPSSWEQMPAAENGNAYRRFGGLLCIAPCPKGYHNSGPFCTKDPHYLPGACAQAQIFRAFRGKPLATPEAMPRYTPNRAFKHMAINSRQRELLAAWERKSDYMYACNLHCAPYDFVSRHVCASIDKYKMDETLRAKVRGLCAEAYCTYGEVEKKAQKGGITFVAPGQAPGFCASSSYNTDALSQPADDPAESAGSIFIAALSMAFLALLALVIFYSLSQSLSRTHLDVMHHLCEAGLWDGDACAPVDA